MASPIVQNLPTGKHATWPGALEPGTSEIKKATGGHAEPGDLRPNLWEAKINRALEGIRVLIAALLADCKYRLGPGSHSENRHESCFRT